MTDPIKTALEQARDYLTDLRLPRSAPLAVAQAMEGREVLESINAALEGLEKAEPVAVYESLCANCGKPGSQAKECLSDYPEEGEWFCSHECKDLHDELGCPHEHHHGYRHPAEAKRLIDCENALRSLACWLGVGGYNAPTVDAKVFEEKIRNGVQDFAHPAPVQDEPAGWKLAPVEPTPEMGKAGAQYAECGLPANAVFCYRAMLAVACKSTVQLVDLTSEQIDDVGAATYCAQDRDSPSREDDFKMLFARAVIAEFCRVNGIKPPEKGGVL